MLDSNSAAALVACHPRLYHVVYRSTADTYESIRTNGLVSGVPRHRWHQMYRSRPGHVYLATQDYLPKVRGWGERSYTADLYAVDSTALVPSRLNPDEDWFITRYWIEDDNPCRTFHLPFPPTHWHWDWAVYLGMAPLPSYGEWADAVSLGSDPQQTLYSLTRGSVAYRGDIPPSALRLIHSTREDTC